MAGTISSLAGRWSSRPEDPGLSTFDRRGLRDALRSAYPWLDETDVGPRSVEAGECDRCGDEARLVATCGPVAWAAIGRHCAADLGTDAWCDGHRADALRCLAWLRDLPDEADDVARLWWIATGEVRLDTLVITRPERLDDGVRGMLPS